MLLRILFALALLLPSAASAQSSFDQFRGHFKGSATGTFTSGATESFTCTATNGGSGNELTINMRCANSSGARFEVRSRLSLSGSSVSGTWRIIDPSYDGTISGSIQGSRVSVAVSGSAFSGTVVVSRSGASLAATIQIANGVKLVANLR